MLTALVFLAVGYAIGRWQPYRRASDWAHWQRHSPRPTGPRLWATWTVLSAENIAWLLTHPVRGVHAWRHRNDPPPRSPAMTFRHPDDTSGSAR